MRQHLNSSDIPPPPFYKAENCLIVIDFFVLMTNKGKNSIVDGGRGFFKSFWSISDILDRIGAKKWRKSQQSQNILNKIV